MRTDISSMNGIYLNYYVMFKSDAPTDQYNPLVMMPSGKKLDNNGFLHGFDLDLEGILPALWYCLHLPRHGFDTLDLSPKVIASGVSVPHSIFLIPSNIEFMSISNITKSHPPTLVICEDSCSDIANKFASDYSAPLGSVAISAFSTDLLRKHWAAITQLIQAIPIKNAPLKVKPEIFSEQARTALPMSFMGNQLNFPVMESLKGSNFSQKSRLGQAIYLRSIINTLVDLEKREVKEPTEEEFSNTLNHHMKSTSLPIVITLPGTTARRLPRRSTIEQEGIGPTEKAVVDILGIHRASARGGVWLDGGTLSPAMFRELFRLENHCRASRKDNRFVWDSMKRIGEYLSEQIGSTGMDALVRASHITAYTDFPIGIAILPGTEDPLCCIKPISYRPLTPLTRSLQLELPRKGEHYIGRGFKVVIAECLSPKDKIRPYSDAAWKMTRDMFQSDQRVQVVYSEVQSINSLKELLLAHSDADILIISAHGYYSNDMNIAGLCVGNEVWLATEDEIHVPPVVILSACHVAPRGLGAVTVTDLLLRAGAVAVLGTLIPVDVWRNALITQRLFVYISEALEGRGQFRSLDEAWKWVVASNAVNEVLASSEKLTKWAKTQQIGKLAPIQEFMLTRSKGRLRTGHVYSDTIEVLREMMADSSYRRYFDAVMSSQSFFPESCFYTWSGAPENIILTEPIIEQYLDLGGL